MKKDKQQMKMNWNKKKEAKSEDSLSTGSRQGTSTTKGIRSQGRDWNDD